MALTTSDYGDERLQKLCDRFDADDPTLTPEEVDELRLNTATVNWRRMTRDRAVRDRAKVTSIAEGRTQFQIAQDYRERAKPLLNDLLALINEARREHHMAINFQFSMPDGFDQQHLVLLEINTKLC